MNVYFNLLKPDLFSYQLYLKFWSLILWVIFYEIFHDKPASFDGTSLLYLPVKDKGHAHNRPQGPKGVPHRLRPRIFLTFGTTRVVGRQPHAQTAFTYRGNPWYSFLEAESTPGHMVPSVATEKIPSVTPPGIDPETVQLVAQVIYR
jgi:hypothetical protein